MFEHWKYRNIGPGWYLYGRLLKNSSIWRSGLPTGGYTLGWGRLWRVQPKQASTKSAIKWKFFFTGSSLEHFFKYGPIPVSFWIHLLPSFSQFQLDRTHQRSLGMSASCWLAFTSGINSTTGGSLKVKKGLKFKLQSNLFYCTAS